MGLKKGGMVLSVILLCAFLLVWFLGIIGLLSAFLSAVIIVDLADPDRNFLVLFYKLFRGVSFWAEKRTVAKELEVAISSASKEVNREGLRLLPHGLRVKWARPMDSDAFLKQGKVVVCLESSDNEPRNAARATLLYVRYDLIRNSRRFVHSSIMKSATFATARKMLMIKNNTDALQCLSEEFMEPEADKTPVIRQYVPSMDRMDEEGLFTRVLLREFSLLGPKLSPALSSTQAEQETVHFTNLLKTFEERKKEQDVPLDHNGKVIRVSLMPVARATTEFNVLRYVRTAVKCSEDGIDTIYVLARGANVTLAKMVTTAIERTARYTKKEEWEFEVQKALGKIAGYVAVMARTTR